MRCAWPKPLTSRIPRSFLFFFVLLSSPSSFHSFSSPFFLHCSIFAPAAVLRLVRHFSSVLSEVDPLVLVTVTVMQVHYTCIQLIVISVLGDVNGFSDRHFWRPLICFVHLFMGIFPDSFSFPIPKLLHFFFGFSAIIILSSHFNKFRRFFYDPSSFILLSSLIQRFRWLSFFHGLLRRGFYPSPLPSTLLLP